MLLSNTSANRRLSLNNSGSPVFNLTLPEVYSDAREHGYTGPTRHVRLPRATSHGGGSIAKSEDGVRSVVAGRECEYSLRILHVYEASTSGSSTPTEHKSVTGRGGHRIEASRNYWDTSGLKVDSSSTDVAWCHGAFSNKILTSARNGELIMWDINKNGPSKYERRTRGHARSIHVLQYSPILQCYCMTGSADGDLRIWDIRDMTKSIMRIHHLAAIRAVAFSPVSSQSRHVVAALDNGSIYRWDLNMGQRGQLDRISVAHSGPILSLDWLPPSTPAPSMLPSTRQPGSSTWYGAIDEILPSAPTMSGPPASDGDKSGPGWIISGGMDRCVKVWDLTTPPSRSRTPHQPAYTLHTSFPVRRVLWRPGYECELAIVSNADFGIAPDFGHGALPSGPSSANVGLSSGVTTAHSSPRIQTAHLGGTESPGTPGERAKSLTRTDGSDPVEIWDVRSGYIAKWVVNGSAVEGGVTDIDFGDSHALWAVHQSGTFSQLDLRQSRKPLDAIPRSAISWHTAGPITFVTDRPKRWEVPYDDVDPNAAKEKAPMKRLGDPPLRPMTQCIGTYVPEGVEEDLDTITKLARGYMYEGNEKAHICAYNAEVALDVGEHEAAQTWFLLESLLIDLSMPPTPPLSPPASTHSLPHSVSAPATTPTTHPVSSSTTLPQRAMPTDLSHLPIQKDSSPGSRSKYSDERYTRSKSSHRSPHGGTPTSSTASSPRKVSTTLPTVPAAIFARRESGAGLPTPIRPHLQTPRRQSFGTQSILSGHSESPSESLRNSFRHVGEGALDDSDSSEDASDHEVTEGRDDARAHSDRDGETITHSTSVPTSGSAFASTSSPSRTPSVSSAFLHRSKTAQPSPLSHVAGKQAWTEDEKEDEDTPSPASTSEESSEGEEGDEYEVSGDERAIASTPASALGSQRTSTARRARRGSARERKRSRNSTVASFVATIPAPMIAPPPSPLAQSPNPRRLVARQESTSSVRTVTTDVPLGAMFSRADVGGALRKEETVRDLSRGRPGSIRVSSSHRNARTRSEAFSADLMPNSSRAGSFVASVQTPLHNARTSSDQTKAAIREAEDRLRQLGWETMRERFEKYADQGDITMCAVMAIVVPEELKVTKSRVARFVEAYIDILTRLRLHACAAYLRKFVPAEDIRALTALQPTIYTSCGKCRKAILLPGGSMARGGKSSGNYAFCSSCKGTATKCSICYLPVRESLSQCPICLHGGHRECYRAYYERLPPVDMTPPPQSSSSHRVGLTLGAHSPRGRALSREGSTLTDHGELDDGASALDAATVVG
ncbi:hypothetical protein BC628DRAFT_1491791 [Trametes gibbosa]|nr:hypothetical protein BC628DRAFT_1491791 [Trametes gibbosa]